MPTVAILPVKRFDHAKRRLRDELSAQEVGELAESMLADVLRALIKARQLGGVILVTQEPRAAELARRHGATVLDDDERGHNPAATRGIEHAIQAGATRVLLVPGDCPRLDPAEIDALIARPAPARSVLIVPDRHGTGTNALLLTPPRVIEPSFGPGSCARHRLIAEQRDIHAEVLAVPSLALDIDTPADLAALAC